MTRTEFLGQLRSNLGAEMNGALVEDNIRFYENYFAAEEAKGRAEGEILRELGDPRILAKSLIDAAQRSEAAEDGSYRDADGGRTGKKNGGRAGGGSGGRGGFGNGKLQMLPWWLILILVILLLVAVISVVGTLVWTVLPYLLPVLVVVLIIRLFRRS